MTRSPGRGTGPATPATSGTAKWTSRLSAARPDEPPGGAVLAALTLGDEHLDRAPDLTLALVPRDVVDERDQPLVALLHDVSRHLVGHVAAGVPGRLEYWNVKALANRAPLRPRPSSARSPHRSHRGSRR